MRQAGMTDARRFSVLAALGLAMLALTACDYFSQFQRIGATQDAGGSIQIVYLACDYESISAVALYDGHDPAVESDDELLWEIRSEDGRSDGVFTVGSQPDEWTETVSLEGDLGDNLIASIELGDSVGAAMTFSPADLEPGQVWTTGDPDANVDEVAFTQRARESCEDGGGDDAD